MSWTTKVFDKENAVYTVETFLVDDVPTDHQISIKEKGTELLSNSFITLNGGYDYEIALIIYKIEKKLTLLKILDTFTQEMENYSYYGSNPGISKDSYEDVVDALMAKYFIK